MNLKAAEQTAETIRFVLSTNERTPELELVLEFLYDRLGVELGRKELVKVAA